MLIDAGENTGFTDNERVFNIIRDEIMRLSSVPMPYDGLGTHRKYRKRLLDLYSFYITDSRSVFMRVSEDHSGNIITIRKLNFGAEPYAISLYDSVNYDTSRCNPLYPFDSDGIYWLFGYNFKRSFEAYCQKDGHECYYIGWVPRGTSLNVTLKNGSILGYESIEKEQMNAY